MEYHYSEVCMPSDQLMNDQYHPEYSQPYTLRNEEAEYVVRNSILVDGGNHYGVSSVVFDKYEELIWMGNQGGHVTSYYGPTMQKYTSFQIHVNEEVRDILTVDAGIYCLTKSTLRHQLRRGIPRHTYKSPNMTDMQCLFQVNSNKFLMGGHQDKLLELDLNKMAETVIKIPEDGCAVLRSGGGSLIACGSANGTVALRDIRCPGKAEHIFRAHTACLSDLDMQGDQLITCGFTQSGTIAVPENYIQVWDVRKQDKMWSIPTASAPLLLHFLPAVSGRAVAVSGNGHVTLLHVNGICDSDYLSVFQVDTHNALCSVMDVSSTSQALAFGDQSGHLNLFSAQHNHEPVFNNFSRATEFADPLPNLPYASFNNTNFAYSSIPLPPLQSGQKWFNELPAEFFKKVYRKPRTIDPEVLRTMKMQGPIGYAPNPRTHLRNEKPYIDDNLDDLLDNKKNDAKSNIQPIPREYLKVELRYNKHGPNDEIDAINKTGMPGLESTLPNSYCNAMLQVLYHIVPLKTTLLAHTCAKEFCLSCELGFLFRMLDTSNGTPCQATNFLRAFRTVPEAAALGLILPDRGEMKVDLVALIQSWNRFILHQIHSEILETRKKQKELTFINQKITPPRPFTNVNANHQNGPFEEYRFTELEFLGPAEYDENGDELKNCKEVPVKVLPETNHVQNHENHTPNKHKSDKEESEISQLFAIGRQQVNKCTKCNKEEERESAVLACALASGAPFAEQLRASLAPRRATPAWCERCGRFTHTVQRGRVLRLPPILAINCGITAQEKAHWAKGGLKDMPETSKRGGSGKPCRYGLHCARPGCRFKHPERPLPSPQANSIKNTDNQCVLPHQLSIRLQPDGEVVISDKNHAEVVSWSQYTLSSVVAVVEDSPRNLVAYVRVPQRDRWYLFNDLCIVPVSSQEVVQQSWWKSPCVVFYAAS